ncbi:uncharacterized protein [Epargyreus clarus]|uniref:uncharacterized protein n=1 Tax=Epargyreus clarus TaxID=520877 RepID=UPI003C2BA46A
MDDFAKHASSYQLDQEILDARGINMTVEEVAGLPTCKYSERVQSLHLSEDDLVFLKGLRRRIKNRLASQNSRRRSTEQLRRLARELRALRAGRHAAVVERRALLAARARARDTCRALREHVLQVLKDRSDPTEVPDVDPDHLLEESQSDSMSIPSEPKSPYKETLYKEPPFKEISYKETGFKETPFKESVFKEISYKEVPFKESTFKESVYKDEKNNKFECRIEKLVQQSVNHIYKEKKKVTAKTVFITDDSGAYGNEGVLNLSVKKRGHGRKQAAPRRIACLNNDDGVLDLKIKKENQ